MFSHLIIHTETKSNAEQLQQSKWIKKVKNSFQINVYFMYSAKLHYRHSLGHRERKQSNLCYFRTGHRTGQSRIKGMDSVWIMYEIKQKENAKLSLGTITSNWDYKSIFNKQHHQFVGIDEFYLDQLKIKSGTTTDSVK